MSKICFGSSCGLQKRKRTTMIGLKIVCVLLCAQILVLTHALTIRMLGPSKPGEKVAFSMDDFLSGDFSSVSFNGTWISETEILYRSGDMLLKFDTTELKSETIARNIIFDAENYKMYLSPDKNYVLLRDIQESVYRHSSLSRYSIYCIETKSLTQLAHGRLLSTAFWAPVGSALAYVLNNDVYYHQLNGNSVETRRITFDGKSQAIYNGVPDWVYEEEVFSTDRTMWFSPDGEHLAFASFNDTEVHEAVILKYGIPSDLRNQYPTEEKFRYPKSGTKNPEVSLNIVDLTDHGSPIITLKAPTETVGSEPILYAVTWFNDKVPVATWTNRVQNISQIVSYSLTGQYQPLLTRESPGGWVLYTTEVPLYQSGYMIMLKAQPVENKTLGLFGHVTRFRLLNGVLDHEVDLTPGNTWVQNIHGINNIKRVIYYSASPPGEPSQTHLYEVSLDVPKDSVPTPKCLSCELKSPEGNNCKSVGSVKFSTNFSRYVITCAGPDPPTIKVYDQEGSELYTWNANRGLRDKLSSRILPKQMDLTIESHGFDCKVRLLLPDDFDPSLKYPMLVNVYGGPDSQRINDNFGVGFETYMSTNKHVIHASIDGRGSSSKGTAMLYAVYRQLGIAEIEDQITVTKTLQHKFPWIDSNRTAIWGWSYGGYATTSVLTRDEDNVFKCGLSVAPVTNWIYYDSIYTERFMGLPTVEDNLRNYENGDVLRRAHYLSGKKFMLIHGTGDDNVHYQQSMLLNKVLADNDILYDQVSYADEAHGLINVSKHLYHTMDKFWGECFGYKTL